MKKSDKVLRIIGLTILIAVIITFNIIIGANEKGLRVLPISILMGCIIIYLIVLKVKRKKDSIIFKSKIDYLVLLFMLTTTLPLIFKTYVSYSDTVEFIMKYFFIYSVYLLARNVLKDKKSIEVIITVSLIASLIPIMLGFDYDHTKILEEFTKWLNVNYTVENAFHGTFGYANAQAVCCALCVLLTIYRFKTHKSKTLKIVDVIYIAFMFYIIYITASRAIMILLGITLFVLFVEKFKRKIEKNKKKILIGIAVIVLILQSYLIISLRISKPIIKENEDIDEKIIYNFKQNETYNLELNITTEDTKDSIKNTTKVFRIELIQIGPYFKESTILKLISDKVNGYYALNFTPTQNCKYLRIKIINLFNGKIRIDDFFINGKKQIVEYKYIPNKIGHFLSKFYIEGKSLPQRVYMYQDCFKMASDSPIVGNGGNTWKNVSRAVEDYKIALKECHSYVLELLISYGIIGVTAYLVLIICFFAKIFKQCKKDTNKRKNKLLIVLGLLITILHCTIDFDMSFMLIMILVYTFIAALLYDEQCIGKHLKKNKIRDYIVLIFLIFILSLYIRADISKYVINEKSYKYNVTSYNKEYYHDKLQKDINTSEDTVYLLNEINKFMDKEVYHYSSINNYKDYFKIIINNIDKLHSDDLNKYLNIGINRLKTVRFRTPMYYDTVLQRAEMLTNVIKDYKQYLSTERNEKKEIIINATEELKQILYNEYEINTTNILDYEKTGLTESEKIKYIEKYNNLVNSI